MVTRCAGAVKFFALAVACVSLLVTAPTWKAGQRAEAFVDSQRQLAAVFDLDALLAGTIVTFQGGCPTCEWFGVASAAESLITGDIADKTTIQPLEPPETPPPPDVDNGTACWPGEGPLSISGWVNPNGSPTTAYFQWGITPALGNNTSLQSVGRGTDEIEIFASISPDLVDPYWKTLYFRVVAQNYGGTAVSEVAPPINESDIPFCDGEPALGAKARASGVRSLIGGTRADGAGFMSIAPPVIPPFRGVKVSEGVPPAMADAWNALFANQAQHVGFARAFLTAIERRDAATAAGNLYWQRLQSVAAAQYAEMLAAILEAQLGLREAARQAWWKAGRETITVTQERIWAYQEWLRYNGPPPSLVDGLKTQGVDSAGVTEIVTRLARAKVDVVEASFPTDLRTPVVDQALAGAAEAFRAFRRSVGALDSGVLLAAASVNQNVMVAGEPLMAAKALHNPGLAAGLSGSADFYEGVVLPDGRTIVFHTGGGQNALGNIGDIASFKPVATGVSLAAPFAVAVPDVFSYQWNGGEPRGTYTFFVLGVKAGAFADGVLSPEEVLVVSTAAFAFP
jgi:hypothetical protein